MLWWFLILGFSAVVVVLVAIILFIRVRRQMKHSTTHKAELDRVDHDVHAGPAWPPEA